LFHHLADDGTPEAVLFFVALVPNALEFVEVVRDQPVQAGGLWIPKPIDSLEDASPRESNCWHGKRANLL
jgi:hypothetical protein